MRSFPHLSKACPSFKAHFKIFFFQKAFPHSFSSHLLLISPMPDHKGLCIMVQRALLGRDLGDDHQIVVLSLDPTDLQESVNILRRGKLLSMSHDKFVQSRGT